MGVGGVGSRLKDFNIAGNSMRIIKQLPVRVCARDTKKRLYKLLPGVNWYQVERGGVAPRSPLEPCPGIM